MERLLRGFFLMGAALDAAATASLLHPEVTGHWLGASGQVSPETLYCSRTAAALMAGWTALLVWGAARPLERRFLLALTALPVIAGLMAAEIAALRAGVLGAESLPLLGLQGVLVLSALVLGSPRPLPWSAGRGLG